MTAVVNPARRGRGVDLTGEDVSTIRRSLDSAQHLADVYHVSPKTIGRIRARQGRWADQ